MRLTTPWHKATCLYCFHRFHLSEAHRRVMDGGATETEKDEEVARFLNRGAMAMGRVIRPPPRGSVWRRLLDSLLLWDDPPGQKKLCPRCHMYLPASVASGELSGDGLAIIGAQNSGKSHFFGVLINALEKRYCEDLHFTMFDQDTFDAAQMAPVGSRQMYRVRYGEKIFNRKGAARAVDKTRSAGADVNVRIPLIYRLQFRKRAVEYLTRPFSRVSAMDLAIYDTAGEDMESERELIDRLYPFIVRARGIIFLIDPFQYHGLRDQLPPEVRAKLPVVAGDPAEIVTKVRRMFEEKGLVRAGEKIRVPVAFTLSKADLLRGLVYPGSPILRDSDHRGGFDLADCEEVSRQVAEYVKRWDTVELANKAAGLFADYKFFAVSALGTFPGKDDVLSKVEPLRIADPLLWLLYRQGYIPAKPAPGGRR
jgi:hypothetical protein